MQNFEDACKQYEEYLDIAKECTIHEPLESYPLWRHIFLDYSSKEEQPLLKHPELLYVRTPQLCYAKKDFYGCVTLYFQQNGDCCVSDNVECWRRVLEKWRTEQ